MRQILKPINSGVASDIASRRAAPRLAADAALNSAIKTESQQRNRKVSASEVTPETVHRQATCHGACTRPVPDLAKQKENENLFCSSVTRSVDKPEKCLEQSQSGVACSTHNLFKDQLKSSRGFNDDELQFLGFGSRFKHPNFVICAFIRFLSSANMFVQRSNVLQAFKVLYHSELSLYLFIAFISSLCFVNSLHGDFVHDDIPALVQNPDVLGTTSIAELFTHDFWGRPMADPESHKSYRPITTLTFRLNMALNVNPFGFHLVNLVLHSAVSLLVTRLARRVLHFTPRLTLLGATLFATHPIHCEAVSSIVGRADVLCALFYLLSFLAFHKTLQCSQCNAVQVRSLCLSVLWACLALLCKETGVTVFGVCAFYWFASRLFPALHASSTRRYQMSPAALFMPGVAIISSFAILLTLRLRIFGGALPFFSEQDNPASYSKSILTRVLTYLHLAVFNVRLLISPSQQAYDYQTGSIHLVNSLTDLRNVTTVGLLLGFAAAAYRVAQSHIASDSRTPASSLAKSRVNSPVALAISGAPPRNVFSSHALLVSLLFLVLPYMPASNLFLTVGFVVAERLLYIPSIGFTCLLINGISQLSTQSNRAQSPSTQKWLRQSARIAELTLASLVLIFAAKTLQQNQVWNSRESLYRLVILTVLVFASSGIVNVPSNAKAHYNYANLQQDKGNLLEAMRHYQTAIRLWPSHASAHNNLGALFWRLSEPERAERHFATALQINPYHAKAHFNLGKVYSKRGQTWEAIMLMERSIRLDSRFGESYEALATLYAQLGQLAIAERLHRKAIRLRPRNSDFHNNYGAFLQKTGRIWYSIRQYKKALELKSNHQIALLNVANALISLQKFQQAEQYIKKALKLNEDPATLDSLGALFLRQSKLHLARHVYEYIWNHYFDKNWTKKTATKTTLRDLKETPHLLSSEILSTANIRIHYAQLLILEGRYADAEVLLEALTRLEHSDGNENDASDAKATPKDDWTINHSTVPLLNERMPMIPQTKTEKPLRRPESEVSIDNSRMINKNDRQDTGQVTSQVTMPTTSEFANNDKTHLGVSSSWAKSTEHANQSSASAASILPGQRLSRSNLKNARMTNPLNKWLRNRLQSEGEQRDGRIRSHQLATSLLLIDVHHQLALLYTLTNRSAEALDSIANALTLCSSATGTMASRASTMKSGQKQSLSNLLSQNSRCAQIYTLQGDIKKDLQQWPDAIKSYHRAIQLDECLGRPHLNLAVIYHINEQYSEAMMHYTYASQLDASGTHSGLISENMTKLRRQQQMIQSHHHSKQSTATQQKCQSRSKAMRAQSATPGANNQSPNTTFDYAARRSSFISDSNTDADRNLEEATSGLFRMHSILSSL